MEAIITSVERTMFHVDIVFVEEDTSKTHLRTEVFERILDAWAYLKNFNKNIPEGSRGGFELAMYPYPRKETFNFATN